METFMNQCQYFLEQSGYQLITVIIVAILGILIIKSILKLVKQALLQSALDNSLVKFVLTIVKFVLYLALSFYCLSQLKIPLSGFVAALSAATLAIGLAIQDIIGGIANGLMLVTTRPFKVNDFVQIGSISGVIKEITLMHTILNTTDNKRISLPNKTVFNSDITNYSANPLRRLDITFGVDYDSDIEQVKRLIENICRRHPLVLAEPAPMVRLTNHNESSLDFITRVWVQNGDYWTVNFDLKEQVMEAFNAAGIGVPFPQVTLSYRAPVPAETTVEENVIKEAN